MARIGIIGLGFMGRMHLGAYEKIKGAEVVGLADEDAKRASGDFSGGWGNVAGAATQLKVKARGTTDWRELLEWEEVDIVDICVPTPMHLEIATAALAAGKHVLCEKPLALTSGEARQIAEAAAKSKGYFMPAMCMRFWPQWAWLKQAVEEGRYGKVLGATFRRVASMPPGWFVRGEMSGGAVLDLHIHDSDFVHYLFGRPRWVLSRGYSKTSGEIDHVVTQYGYDEVPVVCAEGSWCMSDGFVFSMAYTVNFERATADFDISRETPLTVFEGGKGQEVELSGDGYEAELRYFVECVDGGRRPATVTAEDAVGSIEVVEAEKKSIASGSIVRLD